MGTTRWAVAVAVGILGLAGCGSDEVPTGSVAGSSAADRSSEASGAVLTTADSPLGEIVVDGDGRTVYVFDEDVAGSGESACSGDCLATWPAVTADSESPGADGVTGEIGTITRDDGTMQLTLAGMPLYSYAGDSQPGDVTGQAVGGIRWVVRTDGAKVFAPASSAPPPAVPGY